MGTFDGIGVCRFVLVKKDDCCVEVWRMVANPFSLCNLDWSSMAVGVFAHQCNYRCIGVFARGN